MNSDSGISNVFFIRDWHRVSSLKTMMGFVDDGPVIFNVSNLIH